MVFDLHRGDRRAYPVNRQPQHRQVEVAHADCARATLISNT